MTIFPKELQWSRWVHTREEFQRVVGKKGRRKKSFGFWRKFSILCNCILESFNLILKIFPIIFYVPPLSMYALSTSRILEICSAWKSQCCCLYCPLKQIPMWRFVKSLWWVLIQSDKHHLPRQIHLNGLKFNDLEPTTFLSSRAK